MAMAVIRVGSDTSGCQAWLATDERDSRREESEKETLGVLGSLGGQH